MNRLDDLISEYNSLGIRNQIDYDKLYLYSVITHSTAIEGSTISEIENQLLFDEGISANKPMAEQLMNLDLKHAYEAAFRMAEEHREITVPTLIELSGWVMKNTGSLYNTIAGTFDSSRGELRLLNVSAGRGGKSYIAWQKVPGRLETFCAWLNKVRADLAGRTLTESYEESFRAHYRIVSIHPWADGNGRMARMVMNMIQHEAGIVPSIVKKEHRAAYIESLARAQLEEEERIFLDFMLEEHCSNIEEQIREYQQSMER